MENLEIEDQPHMDIETQEAVDFMTERKGKAKVSLPQSIFYSSEEDAPKAKKERSPRKGFRKRLPWQVRLLQRPEPILKQTTFIPEEKADLGGKEFKPSHGFSKSCNMVFILPMEAMAKEDQLGLLEGDIVEIGKTAQILGKSARPSDEISSVISLKMGLRKMQ